MAVDTETGQVSDDYVVENANTVDEPVAAGVEIPKGVMEKIVDPEKAANPQEWQHLRRKYDAPLRELQQRTELEQEAADAAAVAAKPPEDEPKERDPGTGRFAKQETGDPDKKPGGDGQPEKKPGAEQTADPLHDFMGKRLARERRKGAKEISDLRAENARLKAGNVASPPDEPPGGGEIEEPNIDDPKYEQDADGSLYLADLDAWEAQEKGDKQPKGQGEQQRKGAPQDRKPEASPAAQAVADLVRMLDGADEEGKLATEFDEGLEKKTIVISDELLAAFDSPAFPEEEFVRVAKMFLEKPWTSRRISRQEPGTHFHAMLALLGRYEDPPTGGGEQRQTREPLRGGGRGEPAKGKDAADYAMEGDIQSYYRVRKAEERAKEEPWIN